MADPPATPPAASDGSTPAATPAGATTPGEFVLKNMVDMSDDTELYDAVSGNPMSFIANMTQKAAVPNILRNRKRFYGRFICRLWDPAEGGGGAPEGDSLWDPTIAALKRAGGESTAEMQLFVCVVHVEELQSLPYPKQDDWEAIFKIANNGGIFKSYVYGGEDPKYGDNVMVAYADPSTRTEGIFVNPLVGGVITGGGGPNGGRRGAAHLYGNCQGAQHNVHRRPRKSEGATNSSEPQTSSAEPAAATSSTPPAATSSEPAPTSTPAQPTSSEADGETPTTSDGRKPLPPCDSYGKPIFWKRTGKAEDMRQIGPERMFGTDWSKWNAMRYLKFNKLKNDEGIEFVIIKCTQGAGSGLQGTAKEQFAGAKNVGMKVGPYHFCASEKAGDPKVNAKKEFDNFKAKWKSVGSWDITPSLDFESGRSKSGKHSPFAMPAGAIHNMTFYLEFLRLIKAETGNWPIIYTAAWARGNYMDGARSNPMYKEIGKKSWLWWAEYVRRKDPTKSEPLGGRRAQTWNPWSGYDIWQFSGWGRFESLDGQGKFDFNSMKKSSIPKLKWGANMTPAGFSG